MRSLSVSKSMRRFPILLSVSVLTTVTFAAKSVTMTVKRSEARTPQSPPGVIDGSLNPELISDYSAYSMLFRLISNHPEPELRPIRVYLKQMRLGEACESCSQESSQGDAKVNALLAAAQEFYMRVNPIDLRIADIRRQNPNTNPTVQAQLERLNREKETICEEVVASLPLRLGISDAVKVRLHVAGMKRKMKIRL